MSEMINNREYRQKVLKDLIMELHNGSSVEDVKSRFADLIEGVSTKEIADMEQALVMEGMPIAEIQNLCDVHAAVFKGSIEEIHQSQKPEEMEGHPIHTFQMENIELKKLLSEKIVKDLEDLQNFDNKEQQEKFLGDIKQLWEIDRHYARKENLLFPFMEKYGITAPPKVMWGVDDEIRGSIKKIIKLLTDDPSKKEEIIKLTNETVNRINEMIYKEENILFPMVLETLSEDEWVQIMEASEEIGYTLMEPKRLWKPTRINLEKKEREESPQEITNQDYATQDNKTQSITNNGNIRFDAGMLSPVEANAMLNTLPLDITFVDKDGLVKYFTQGKERIFPRPKTIIGREVKNCHPPASVHIVEQIVEDLKSGKKEHEDFWIKMNGKFVYIRYYAVRNEQGEFLGVMEVTQDIKPIQELSGEKRLASEN